MVVKAFWFDVNRFGRPRDAVPIGVGAPVFLSNRVCEAMGKVERVVEGRALVRCKTPVQFQELENMGVGFADFEDFE